jgi:cytochrome c oxidase subunit III
MNILTEHRSVSRFNTGRIVLFLILASESIFFATMLVAYISLRDQAILPVEHTLRRLIVPLANTLILFVSTFFAWRGTVSIRRGQTSALTRWLLFTILLGFIFIFGQIYEFSRGGMHINDQAFGGIFITLIAFHGLHVLAGLVFLIINLVRSRLGDFSVTHDDAIVLGTWFWYYVAAVWLVLFAALYLI